MQAQNIEAENFQFLIHNSVPKTVPGTQYKIHTLYFAKEDNRCSPSR